MAHSITNKLRGLVAAFVAVFAALALVPGTAFAAPTNSTTNPVTVTVNGLNDDDQVTLYRVLDTYYDSETNSVTHQYPTGFMVDGYADGTAFANAYAATSDASGTGQLSQKVLAAVNAGGAVATDPVAASGDNATVTLTVNNFGLYFVKVVNTKNDSTRLYQNMIVPVQPKENGASYTDPDPVTVDLKSTEVTVDKKANGQDDVDTYAKGDIVPFTITTFVPTYPETATDRVFNISDSLSGMELVVDQDHPFALTVDGNTVDAGDYTITPAADSLNGATNFIITFTNDFILSHGGQQVVVSYFAKITSAEYNDPDSNTAKVEFSRNPTTEETYTPEDTTHITFYGYGIKKVDGAQQTTTLAGAEFDVYHDDGTGRPTGAVIDHVATDDDGLATIDGLGEGKYVLVETKAPTGYQLSTTPIPFVITAQTPGEDFAGFVVNAGNPQSITNTKNPALPVTGGAGTVAFTAAGVVLIAGAAAFIVRSRKQN